MATVAAVDLGATSGRVLVGTLDADRIMVREELRFAHGPIAVPRAGGYDLVWDIPALWQGILKGLRHAGPIDAIGVDTWAVDYGRLDENGRLLGLPESYRSPRTDTIIDDGRLPSGAELFTLNGLAAQQFNTCYQLLADLDQNRMGAVAGLALLPDLISYWLTGNRVTELTNASTTGLIDPRTRQWQPQLVAAFEKYGLDLTDLFGPLVESGHVIGRATACGIDWQGAAPAVVAVGSHDTASAVAAVPATISPFAYVSSGTWSLVGLELDEPVCTSQAWSAGFANELGVDGTVRFLKNVAGMWVQSQCFAQWDREGVEVPEWNELDSQTELISPRSHLMNICDQVFFAPGDMTGRIDDACRAAGYPIPHSIPAYMRCIYDSLALAYRRCLDQAREVTGIDPQALHIVGGGAKNALLCQAAADATGLDVIAGPVEATAIGNLAVTLQAIGAIKPGLDSLRSLVINSFRPKTYHADSTAYSAWDRANSAVK